MMQAPKHVLMLVTQSLHIDPRISWFTHGLDSSFIVTQIGMTHNQVTPYRILVDTHKIKKLEINYTSSQCLNINPDFTHVWQSLAEDIQNLYLSMLKHAYDQKLNEESRELILSVINFTNLFVTLLHKFNEFDIIVAVDADSLLAGVILSQWFNIPLVFDAHEFWAEQSAEIAALTKNLWIQFEKTLVKYVNIAVTVSTPLAAYCSEIFDKEYLVVPNAESYAAYQCMSRQSAPEKLTNDANCAFLFQGGFAPGRGIDKLIALWPKTPDNCLLFLRGNPNQYSVSCILAAKATGLYNKRIFFPAPVTEDKLILAATQADVGIIPYEAGHCINNQYCCPNKMSQYFAAGIPVLSNNLVFVNEIISAAKAGKYVDFDNEAEFLQTIQMFSEEKLQRKSMGVNARKYFVEKFNWEILSKNLYSRINLLPMNPSRRKLKLFSFCIGKTTQRYILTAKIKTVLMDINHKTFNFLRTFFFNYILICVPSRWHAPLIHKLKRLLRRKPKIA